MSASINQAVEAIRSFATGSRAASLKDGPLTDVPEAPKDPMFGLSAAYRADTFDRKVDLGVGAYRDDNAKPWVLPVVKKVSDLVQSDYIATY